MPPTVYLHIGLHKTGTTYLQNLLRANREALRDQGIEFPGSPGEPSQRFAVWDLQGRRPRGVKDRRIAGHWDALVSHVLAAELPNALISEEQMSLLTLKQARAAVEAFAGAGSQVQVVVTVRDLARVAVSAWQEEIKNDQTYRWQEFADAIKDPDRIASNPARGFWLRQDVVKICETWEAAVPADRLHVVTVPPSGAAPDALLRRFASVVGFEADKLTEPAHWSNETVGVAGIEVIRRVNERMGGRLNQAEYDKLVKLTLVQMLAKRTEPVRFALPAGEIGWIAERAEGFIATLGARGYRVTGDLDDLRPRVREGARRPDDATDAELLDAALDTLAMLSERHATSWWIRKRQTVEDIEEKGSALSRARAVVYRGQAAAAKLADKNRVAAKAMGVVLNQRDRARERARSRAQRRKQS